MNVDQNDQKLQWSWLEQQDSCNLGRIGQFTNYLKSAEVHTGWSIRLWSPVTLFGWKFWWRIERSDGALWLKQIGKIMMDPGLDSWGFKGSLQWRFVLEGMVLSRPWLFPSGFPQCSPVCLFLFVCACLWAWSTLPRSPGVLLLSPSNTPESVPCFHVPDSLCSCAYLPVCNLPSTQIFKL